MHRRDFLVASAAAGVGVLATTGTHAQVTSTEHFSLKYAPHFGMFQHCAGDDLVDQLKFAADQGFTAWEDNGLKGRSAEVQEQIARTMQALGMQMGVFVASAAFGEATFASGNASLQEKVLGEIRQSIEVAKRVQATWMTVVPGRFELGVEWGYQTANCIDLLKRCSELLEPHQLVMVLEPLNWWTNHAGLFLHKIPQAYQICRAVGSPACKILFDIYHQQIQEGNLIPNMDRAWDEIAYFQIGDNPGRNEPGTGEINYRNVFRHLKSKGYSGILGMEHGIAYPGKEGEQKLIEAYRAADPSAS